ncbi:hypothetical protein [Actinoallomurus rhizosphaericola]|uniref:hypothetical protein n=1 Tax=Actinoallomurus rhizosphaericola TaxID=2952536 RepID=UPI002091244E|nr:hypothetical protein [Actinoallomurus rhizosphaericola]MCO5994187.1 hypothetical protein [Actinoallomurus rhizosphaericola]
MHARTTPPPADIVRTAAVQLAPLVRPGLNVTISSDGIVEIRNPRDSRMQQSLVLREHQNALWWHWVWPGPTRDDPPEYEPMVGADDVDEAARRITNVLHVAEATEAGQ